MKFKRHINESERFTIKNDLDCYDVASEELQKLLKFKDVRALIPSTFRGFTALVEIYARDGDCKLRTHINLKDPGNPKFTETILRTAENRVGLDKGALKSFENLLNLLNRIYNNLDEVAEILEVCVEEK